MERDFSDKLIGLEKALEFVLYLETHGRVRLVALAEIVKSELLKYPNPMYELEQFIIDLKNHPELCDEYEEDL